MLTLKDVHAGYGKAVVLHGVSLEVEDKEVVKVVHLPKVTKVKKLELVILRKSDSKVVKCHFKEDCQNLVLKTLTEKNTELST